MTHTIVAIQLLSVFGSAPAAERPNFVVIMVDDMGYAGVSCFGNPYFQTPEIDRLAAEQDFDVVSRTHH